MSDLYSQMNDYFGSKIYASGGCTNIPDNLTKADVLNAGKQVVLWKDGGCIAQYEFSVGARPENVREVYRRWDELRG